MLFQLTLRFIHLDFTASSIITGGFESNLPVEHCALEDIL